jgi:DNA-directed RNA polymerase specialized sigma24 family protein
MSKVNKKKKFANYKDEARYVKGNLMGNEKFRDLFFYDSSEKCYNIKPICEFVLKQLSRTYDIDSIGIADVQTIMFVKLWSDDWHVLKTYGEEYSIFTWLYQVTFNTMKKYLDDNGFVKTKRTLTPGNTRLLLNKQTPEGCDLFINELMPEGKHRLLLIDIYVNRKSDAEIMKKLSIDEEEFKKLRSTAENRFKNIILQSPEDYEGLLLREKSPRRLVRFSQMENVEYNNWEDNSWNNPFSDVVGVHLSYAEVLQRAGSFVYDFVKMLKWKDTDILVLTERSKGTSPKSLAERLGRRRSWVDNRYSRLKKKFAKALDLWINHFEYVHKQQKGIRF